MSIYPVILSGGAGTRLWPLSVGERPKQFLKLTSDKTMIQETLLRLEGLDIETPIVSCNESHRFLVAQQISEITEKTPKILLEPIARNTAPAIAAACCAAKKNDEDAVVIVLPSDHVIENVTAFQSALKIALKDAENGSLVTFGIVPTFPSTGYGYVKLGIKNEESGSYELDSFVEKPCFEKAEEYLKSGEYSWNSGMFVFKASVFLDELKKYSPEMYELSVKAYEASDFETDFIRLNKEYFEQIKGNSIDYAVMEKTDKGRVVKLDAGWNDVGSWTALYDIHEKDVDGNVLKGNVYSIDTKNSYIRSEEKSIAVIGLEKVVVIESDKSILISTMDRIQDVKKACELAEKK